MSSSYRNRSSKHHTGGFKRNRHSDSSDISNNSSKSNDSRRHKHRHSHRRPRNRSGSRSPGYKPREQGRHYPNNYEEAKQPARSDRRPFQNEKDTRLPLAGDNFKQMDRIPTVEEGGVELEVNWDRAVANEEYIFIPGRKPVYRKHKNIFSDMDESEF
jgi:hypothetical protein